MERESSSELPIRRDTVTFKMQLHKEWESEDEDLNEEVAPHLEEQDVPKIPTALEENAVVDEFVYINPSIPVTRYKHPLEHLSDQQLIESVTDLERDLRHQSLENKIFREFLEYYDKSLLVGFESILDFVQGEGPPPENLLSEYTLRRSGKLDSSSLSCMLEIKLPKVNVSQRIDMVARATEDIQAKLDVFLKKSQKVRTKLKAELQEFRIRESEIRESQDIFKFNIVTHGVDKLTQRIPAEKFIRYMQDWLKSATLNLEKLRLRTASLKVQYKKVSQTFIQRKELGQNVHAVDFDQLKIENKHFLDKIEQKNVHLIEMKKMNGMINLALSKHKKYLQKQQKEFSDLKVKTGEHDKLMAEIQRECDLVAKEVERARERFEYIKNLKESYTVPDIMTYIQLKRELDDYRKNVKIWQRRKKIQDITLNACILQMKNISGYNTTDPMWFVDPHLGRVSSEVLNNEDSDDDEESI